jgi:hypothetical protein
MGIYIVLQRPGRAKTALGIALRRKQAHKKSANFRLALAQKCVFVPRALGSRGEVYDFNYFSEKTSTTGIR